MMNCVMKQRRCLINLPEKGLLEEQRFLFVRNVTLARMIPQLFCLTNQWFFSVFSSAHTSQISSHRAWVRSGPKFSMDRKQLQHMESWVTTVILGAVSTPHPLFFLLYKSLVLSFPASSPSCGLKLVP